MQSPLTQFWVFQLPDRILVSRLVINFIFLSLLKKLAPIIELQTQLYSKQKEFIKGLRNKMPPEELKALNEEIRKLYQELLAIRSKE